MGTGTVGGRLEAARTDGERRQRQRGGTRRGPPAPPSLLWELAAHPCWRPGSRQGRGEGQERRAGPGPRRPGPARVPGHRVGLVAPGVRMAAGEVSGRARDSRHFWVAPAARHTCRRHPGAPHVLSLCHSAVLLVAACRDKSQHWQGPCRSLIDSGSGSAAGAHHDHGTRRSGGAKRHSRAPVTAVLLLRRGHRHHRHTLHHLRQRRAPCGAAT